MHQSCWKESLSSAFSQILAHQTLALLTDEARQVIEQQTDLYTWKDSIGVEDDKMDGLTLVALILRHLCPHHKVDMYAEIGKAKKLTVAQFDNDIHLFYEEYRRVSSFKLIRRMLQRTLMVHSYAIYSFS